MNPISVFFVKNIVTIFFFYGLAFFALGLALALASRRASEFTFVRAIRPLALFGLLHGGHEWIEMFQKIAEQSGGYSPTPIHELLRLLVLVVSFVMLFAFGALLLWGHYPERGREVFVSPRTAGELGAPPQYPGLTGQQDSGQPADELSGSGYTFNMNSKSRKSNLRDRDTPNPDNPEPKGGFRHELHELTRKFLVKIRAIRGKVLAQCTRTQLLRH